MKTRTRTLALASGALAAVLVLAGCSNTGYMDGMDRDNNPMTDNSGSESGAFNDADLFFTMTMIPHHEQAIDMAEVILAKDGVDERVLQLATTIKNAQGPEIELMSSWMDDWGQSNGMGGMNHGGMMSGDDMAALETATGQEATRLFLEQMIVHHEGAIKMAEDQIANGENADVIALAEKIAADQADEILTMQELLGTL